MTSGSRKGSSLSINLSSSHPPSFIQFTFETTFYLIIIYAHLLSFHYCLSTALFPLRSEESYFVANTANGLHSPPVFLCNLIFPLLLLEQFDLNAELQLSQSRSSCGPPIRSRPFAFSSLDKEKKRNLPSSLTEQCRELPGLLALPSTSSNGQWEGGKEQGRLKSDRRSWDQGPGGGQHSHSLLADDSQKVYLLVKISPPATFKHKVRCVTMQHEKHLHHIQHIVILTLTQYGVTNHHMQMWSTGPRLIA